MAKLMIYLTIAFFVPGCVTPLSYVNHLRRASYAPGFEPERKYIEKISQRLDAAILNRDPLEEFWDKMILLPLERFIQFNDNWMRFLDKKAEEYTTVIIPKCEQIIRDEFTQLGVEPQEKVNPFLRTEFILFCMDKPDYEKIQRQVFTQLNQTITTFFEPITRRAASEAQKNQEELSKALQESQSFWQSYSLLYNYTMQEKSKLRLRLELDEKYAPIIQAKQKEWEDSITAEQKELYAVQQVDLQNSSTKEYAVRNFLKALSPIQYALLERQLYMWELLGRERQVGRKRLEKFNELARWLDENSDKARASFSEEMQRRQIEAARTQATAMMLMGLSSMMNAYTNWQNSYYNSYQVIGGAKYFQLYDQFGRYYHGTIY